MSARVVVSLGGTACAVFPAGGATGELLERLLEEKCTEARRIPVGGSTRQNFTFDESATGRQYRFVMPGPNISEPEQEACLRALSEVAKGARYVVASGSLPPGVAPEFLNRVALLADRLGARLVADSSGAGLKVLGQGFFLLKPSLRELCEWAGQNLVTDEEIIASARKLLSQTGSKAVVVSLGHRGALMVTATCHAALAAIQVPKRSSVGAGDSMVGGIVSGLCRGMSLRDALDLGMTAAAPP